MTMDIQYLHEYIEAVMLAHEKKDGDEIFFYRGHSDVEYKLVPSVMRSEEQQRREDFYFHQIRVRCPEAFINCNHIDQLVKMQHYDCPTRLLDVTSNPLVGMYFACKKYSTENKSHAGKVFMFSIKQEELLYYDSDKIRMLSCLAELKYEEKEKICKACERKIADSADKALFDASNNGREVEKLYHAIRSEVPAFDKKMRAIDLKSSYFVQPLKDNPRILKQDGAFLMFGLNMKKEETEESARRFIRHEFRIINQENILGKLDALGINEASLFPEVDKVAGYLKSVQR